LNNVYRNTFNSSSTALTFADSTGTVVNGVDLGSNTETSISRFQPSSNGIPIPDLGIGDDPSKSLVGSMTFSVNPGVRMINDTLSLRMSVLRTVQGSFTGATATLPNVFIDNYASSSTRLIEDFNDETFRLPNKGANNTKYTTDYNATASVTTSSWTSSISLYNGEDYNYNNGLQVINGTLIYPKFNFSGAGKKSTNPNFVIGGDSRNYFNCSGVSSGLPITSSGGNTNYRTYTRYFNLGDNTNYSTMGITMSWNNTSFITSTQSLSENNLWVEVKLPSATGWMDATKPYVTDRYDDGDGCLRGTNPPTISGVRWDVTFGKSGTQGSSGIVILRITASSDWSGYISRIQVSGI
jgi:hypothetical protein